MIDPRATIFRRASESARMGHTSLVLPADLIEKGRRRLAGLAAVLGSLSGLALLFSQVLFAGELPRSSLFLHLLSLGLAMTLIGLALSRSVSAEAALNAGLVYEVVLCWAINLVDIRNLYDAHGALPHLTWASMIIVVYPMVVPLPPGRLLVASALAALSAPATSLILRQQGAELTSDQIVGVSLSPAFAVVLAYVGARMIYAVGLDVSRAREMGAYRLEERLGTGAMGEVWRASHRMLARPAAVKLIAAGRSASDGAEWTRVVRRFEQEAQATARLRSPHAVELYDFGIADGTFYYVMELLDGLDLDDLVRTFGPQPPARVVHICRQICHSLGEAHEAGLVHRDVKPANVFLCRHGPDYDFVKVLDFGLVKVQELSEDPSVSQPGAVVGTPAFLAPELAVGDPIDGRTDLYGLGCIAYWLLTGALVFEADSSLALAAKHVGEPPPRPSSVVEQSIPPDLEQIVLACLAKRPEERPASATALAEQLEHCAVPRWTQHEARTWWMSVQPSIPTLAHPHGGGDPT